MEIKRKNKKTMSEITANYETFIKGKEVNNNSVNLFNKAVKKAVKPKQRGSK